MANTATQRSTDERPHSEEALRPVLLESLFANLGRSMPAVLGVGLLMVAALWPRFDHLQLLGWWGTVVLVALARLGLRRWWQRDRDRRPLDFWMGAFRLGAVLMALSWCALVPLFMWHAAPIDQMFIAFMLAGIVAGAVPSLAADLRLLFGYVLLLLLPVLVTLTTQGGAFGLAMGGGVVIFLVMMAATALEYHRTLRDAVLGQQALATQERETRQLLEHVPTGVFYYDTELRLRDCNRAFAETVQASKGQLLGLDMRRIRDQRILPTLATPIERGEPAHYQGNYIANFSGVEIWGEIHVAPIFDASGRVKGAIGAIQDRTREHQAAIELERIALYDDLTGLPNRKLLQERLRQTLARLGRSRRFGALLYLDLDDFKRINDSHGHAAGDRLLVEFARRAGRVLRAEDTLARLGGDEFVVLAPDVGGSKDEAIHHGQRLAEKLHALCVDSFDIGERQVHTNASIGLVVIEPNMELEELLRRADTAMYRAKAAGKGRTAFYDEAMDRAARDYAHMLERLRIAVAQGGFELHFQPIVRLADGRVVGAEALLRWHDAELGQVAPDRFIPISEESALIEAIGRWVLEQVCRLWAEWREAGSMPAFDYISINVSPRELLDPGYPERLEALLRRYRVEPSRLRLEVTESALAEDVGIVIDALQRIVALGVRCLLDDFGTGYSSLSYLKRLPVSTIKVDREFVRDLQSDPDDAAMIRAVVDIAEQFGHGVVAEGVETAAQREILLAMSPQMLAQGYLFSAPLPARDLLAQVQQRSADPGTGADAD